MIFNFFIGQSVDLFGFYEVVKGLHSFNSITHSLIYKISHKERILFLAKIPKGSEYYVGCDNDVVSNKLIIIEPIYYYETPPFYNDLKYNNLKINKFVNLDNFNHVKYLINMLKSYNIKLGV